MQVRCYPMGILFKILCEVVNFYAAAWKIGNSDKSAYLDKLDFGGMNLIGARDFSPDYTLRDLRD